MPKIAAGCEQQALKAVLPYQPTPIITGPGIITNEVCNNQSGSISGIECLNGTGMAPFTFLLARCKTIMSFPINKI
jgi:hypothetical protein